MARKKQAPARKTGSGSVLKRFTPEQAKAYDAARAMPRATKDERLARRNAIRAIKDDARANG